jgi:CheY-like chemotaxis protein
MNDSLSNRPFSFLDNTIRLLVVGDNTHVRALISEYLSRYRLYSVRHALSGNTISSYFRSARFHVCLYYFGQNNTTQDFALVSKYSNRIPFIIVTDSTEIRNGFELYKCGAVALVQEPIDFLSLQLIGHINNAFFSQIVTPHNVRLPNGTIQNCVDVILNDHPQTVSQWAANAGIAETYLRRIWNDCFSTKPKYVLFLYQMYRTACRYVSLEFIGEDNPNKSMRSALSHEKYRRIRNYYKTKKMLFNTFLH